ncbi:grasp-with-spasm system ATP-grasp peptide maturase [Kordia sp.]|uniref:grasp-with-spasm system ATP-grasp peptide maturase n=1 Tax=Kordia sp. TaxID=1965332 RepID=UPI0025B82A78|nr:grasp-with-spasm system ATP-grasp peptide maturase [Kordia sp.]MCH2193589.1 grasp-with-spasm system ATP-grasp peptide maturase [Kordia sp.]
MILIISKSEMEDTTNQVMDWLDTFNGDYYRLNGEDFMNKADIINGQIQFESFNSEAITVIWNRRWSSRGLINFENEEYYDALGAKNSSTLLRSLRQENGILRSFLHSKLNSKVWTTRPEKTSANKIKNLEIAKSCNLSVPEYIITSNKYKLSQFAKKHERIICKPISETPFFSSSIENDIVETLILYTKSFTANQIEEEIEDTFFKSLFQQQIIKEFEIRVFYLNDTCYSMAIFSQNDKQTQVDFRNYNDAKPNRTVPFILPKEVEENVKKFCRKAEYNIGSLDLIKSTDGKYYFLEINPVGQFGMVSYPCNYNLEKKLAKYLIDENKKVK